MKSQHMRDHLKGRESEVILPQMAIEMLYELTKGEAIITTGVGQHQMWAAQFYKFKYPRQLLTSAGLGAMGYGYPAALGAKVAFPDRQVVDIDGDGSFLMNVQELATAHIEKIAAKAIILNNQHLGMVMQWEDRFYAGNRGNTYLGDPENRKQIYPDYTAVCNSFNVKCERVMYKKDLRAAMQRMLDANEPYVLDIIVPYTEHVLPFIPAGKTVAEMIWKASARGLRGPAIRARALNRSGYSRLPGSGGAADASSCSELLLQLFDAADQLGQLLQSDHLPLGLAVGLSRGPEPFLAVRDVVHHAGLGGDRDAVADLQVAGQSDLPAENHVVAQLGAPGDADLRDDDAMLTHGHVVRDLDEVIYLGAFADDGRPERAAINRHIRAQLHVVADDHAADLGHLAVDAVIEHVAEAIRADDRAGVDAHPVADLGVGIERDVGEEVDVLAEQAVGADRVEALQHRARAQSAPSRPGCNTARCGRSDPPGRWRAQSPWDACRRRRPVPGRTAGGPSQRRCGRWPRG